MPIYSQIETNAGLNAYAATGTGQQLVITRVAVGSGVQSNPATATGLANEIIHSVTIAGNTVTTLGNEEISIIVSNTGLLTGFNLSEYGIFGTIGGGPETLFTYISDAAPIPVPPQSSGTLNIYEYFGLAFANTNNVTVQVASGAYALQADFVTHLGDPAAHPQAFVNPFNLSQLSKQGMIRALNGSIYYYLAGDGTWQPTTPQIANNTTLFVAPGNNNVTPNFSSLANAMNYLNGFNIANGVTVTILIADAVYATSASLFIQHVNGQQINILAQNAAADVSFSGIGSVTGSAYNWNVQLLGVSSVANIHANTTYVNIWNIGSSGPGGLLLTGCYKVIAVSGSTVTIRVPYRGASFPAVGTSNSGWISPLNVILNMGHNQSVYIGNHGVALFRQICIACAAAPSTALALNALAVAGPAFLDRVGVNGFIPSPGWTTDGEYVGIALVYQSGTAFKCCSSGNGHGFTCGGNGSWGMIWCAGSNNTYFGFWAQGGQFVGCYDYVTPGAGATCCAIGNGNHGMLINAGSILVGQAGWENGVEVYGSWTSFYNGAWGCAVGEKSVTISSRNSDLSGANGDYLYSADNGLGDLQISGISVCDLQVIGSRIFSQATGVFNANGVINV